MTETANGYNNKKCVSGTPPRLQKRTIDFSRLESVDPDNPPVPFSFLNERVWLEPEDQLTTHLTYTVPQVHRIVMDNQHLNHHVREEVTGPRSVYSFILQILHNSLCLYRPKFEDVHPHNNQHLQYAFLQKHLSQTEL